MAMVRAEFTTLIIDDLQDAFSDTREDARNYMVSNSWLLPEVEEDPDLLNWWDESEEDTF